MNKLHAENDRLSETNNLVFDSNLKDSFHYFMAQCSLVFVTREKINIITTPVAIYERHYGGNKSSNKVLSL